MSTLGPVTKTSKFVFFTTSAAPAPTWDDALRRLAEADAADGGPADGADQ